MGEELPNDGKSYKQGILSSSFIADALEVDPPIVTMIEKCTVRGLGKKCGSVGSASPSLWPMLMEVISCTKWKKHWGAGL